MPASTLQKSAQQEAPDAYIFHVQEHDPKHACTKKIHAPQLACAKRRVHPSLARVPEMPASTPMRASKRCPRRPLPACVKDGRASKDAAKDARVAPCCPRRKDARVWAVT